VRGARTRSSFAVAFCNINKTVDATKSARIFGSGSISRFSDAYPDSLGSSGNTLTSAESDAKDNVLDNSAETFSVAVRHHSRSYFWLQERHQCTPSSRVGKMWEDLRLLRPGSACYLRQRLLSLPMFRSAPRHGSWFPDWLRASADAFARCMASLALRVQDFPF
jgi:hypothetical protein